jgi:hypothetical protein
LTDPTASISEGLSIFVKVIDVRATHGAELNVRVVPSVDILVIVLVTGEHTGAHVTISLTLNTPIPLAQRVAVEFKAVLQVVPTVRAFT